MSSAGRRAGWKLVGETAGRPPGADRAAQPKKVWLLGLADDWLERLRTVPSPRLGAFPAQARARRAHRLARREVRTQEAGRADGDPSPPGPLGRSIPKLTGKSVGASVG